MQSDGRRDVRGKGLGATYPALAPARHSCKYPILLYLVLCPARLYLARLYLARLYLATVLGVAVHAVATRSCPLFRAPAQGIRQNRNNGSIIRARQIRPSNLQLLVVARWFPGLFP